MNPTNAELSMAGDLLRIAAIALASLGIAGSVLMVLIGQPVLNLIFGS